MHVATTGQIDHRVITRHQKMSMREAAAFEHDGVKFLALSYRETSRALFPGRTPAIGADLRNLDRGWHARHQTRPLGFGKHDYRCQTACFQSRLAYLNAPTPR